MQGAKEQLKRAIYLTVIGISAGAANGFFGGGGGMIVVPLLVLMLGRDPKRVHATALLVILPMTLVSGVIYASYGNFTWGAGLPSCIGVTVGGAAGALLLKSLKADWVTKIFAVVMLAAGIRMVV